jgi:hypothetical protein
MILEIIKIFTRPTLTLILNNKTEKYMCVQLLLSKHVSNFGINKHTFTYV